MGAKNNNKPIGVMFSVLANLFHRRSLQTKSFLGQEAQHGNVLSAKAPTNNVININDIILSSASEYLSMRLD